MPISVVFDPPLPSDSPSTFNTKAFALLGDLNDWSTQANALPGEVATNLSALLAAPPAIGGTTPAAGSFTTLSASGPITLTAANPYISFVGTSATQNWRLGDGIGATSGNFVLYDYTGGKKVIDVTKGTGTVTIPGGITQESVIAPTLLNSWVNYGGVFATAGYWKDTFGVVHFQGSIKSGTTAASTNLFTLPAGYRPSAVVVFPVLANTFMGGIYVDTSGNVVVQVAISASITSLDGISFKV